LNKNSGGSDEALNRREEEQVYQQQEAPAQQEEAPAAEVDEMYGYEYGQEEYGEEGAADYGQ
jgi:hypothetical protein